ncbi:MAG: hypothetical protein NSGCLCUN01_03667 [uncultured Clostridium sp.]
MIKEDMSVEILTHDYPWFIKEYKGRKVITIRDIKELIGINIELKNLSIRNNIFRGKDWNGIGGEIKKEFEKNNNLRYDGEIIFFVYITGFLKILKILIEHGKIELLAAESILREIDGKTKYII